MAALLAATALNAQAFQVTSFLPQGEVSQIRQLVVKFDDSAVTFGDPKAPTPLSLSCNDAQATQSTKGRGRWISDREWVLDFENDLPPGVRCSVQLKSSIKSTSGALLTGVSSYKFNSVGPFIQNLLPNAYEQIDEKQYFAMKLNGPATAQSIRDKVWCAVEGLGERVPVKLIEGPAREALLKSFNISLEAAKQPLRFYTLACNHLPKGVVKMEYTVRLNNVGELPNARIKVEAAK